MTCRRLSRVSDGEVPGSGEVTEVAPGILWIRMPLPFALDHINLWLIREEGGWTLVDTGFGDDPTRAAWEQVERAVLGGAPIQRVVCTHCHPDHMGLAGWMRERWGTPLWTSQTEWLHGRMVSLDSVEAAEANWARFYQRAGLSGEGLDRVVKRAGSYRRSVTPIPCTYRRVRDGDELRIGGDPWRIVVGRGHSPEHVCLYGPARGVLIAGDQVLPSITPNVSVWANEPDAEPLSDFLASLATLRRLPDDLLILPSHGRPFVGLHRRLHELSVHHRERLDQVLSACAQARTAYEVTRTMFARDLDPHQSAFAVGESIAHLNHLVASGVVAREQAPGAPDRYVRRPSRAMHRG